jgi:hypothetical protein
MMRKAAGSWRGSIGPIAARGSASAGTAFGDAMPSGNVIGRLQITGFDRSRAEITFVSGGAVGTPDANGVLAPQPGSKGTLTLGDRVIGVDELEFIQLRQ